MWKHRAEEALRLRQKMEAIQKQREAQHERQLKEEKLANAQTSFVAWKKLKDQQLKDQRLVQR